MFPSFYYLFKYLFNVDLPILDIIKTFGFFMAMAFLAGMYILQKGFHRLEEQGKLDGIKEERIIGRAPSIWDFISNGIFGFILGFKGVYAAQNFEFFRADPAGLIFSTEGNLIAGIIVGAILGYWSYRKVAQEHLPEPQTVNDLIFPSHRVGEIIMIAAFTGIIGAKIFDSLENWEYFISDPLGSLLSFQGLTFYGGFIFATIALIYYTYKKKIPFLHFVDVAAPAVMAAYGIGRLGCHFSGDGDWGDPNPYADKFAWLPDWLWAFKYPGNVAEQGIPIPGCDGRYCFELAQAVYPTPVWEFLMAMIIFGILIGIRKYITIPGILFGIYLIFNGAERYFIEAIRVTKEYAVSGITLTQAQIIAIALICIGIALIIYRYVVGQKENATNPAD